MAESLPDSEIDLPDYEEVGEEAVRALVEQNARLHRLLTVLLRRNGANVEVSEDELRAAARNVFVIEEPRRDHRGVVFRIVEARGCPTCE